MALTRLDQTVTRTTWKSPVTTETSQLTVKALPKHPGGVVLEEFLTPIGISQARRHLPLTCPRAASARLLAKRGVTAHTATRLVVDFVLRTFLARLAV